MKPSNFEFCYTPRKGKVWAKLYRAAAKAIPKGERLCYGTYQRDDKSGVCATSVLALNLCSVDTLIKLGMPILEQYKDGKDEVFVFEVQSPAAVRAIETFVERKFSKDEIASAAGDAHGIADHLHEFCVNHNDDFQSAAVGKYEEVYLGYEDKNRKRAELERADYVRTALLEAAKFADN